MNANLVKTQLFYKIKYDLKGHSRLKTTTLLFKNSLFLLFVLLIEETNAAEHYERIKILLYNDDTCLVFTLLTFLWTTFCPCFKLWLELEIYYLFCINAQPCLFIVHRSLSPFQDRNLFPLVWWRRTSTMKNFIKRVDKE